MLYSTARARVNSRVQAVMHASGDIQATRIAHFCRGEPKTHVVCSVSIRARPARRVYCRASCALSPVPRVENVASDDARTLRPRNHRVQPCHSFAPPAVRHLSTVRSHLGPRSSCHGPAANDLPVHRRLCQRSPMQTPANANGRRAPPCCRSRSLARWHSEPSPTPSTPTTRRRGRHRARMVARCG